MFIGKYNKSVVVTYLGTLSAMIGIYFIVGVDIPNPTAAIICLMISGICDMFDGKVARMCKNRTKNDIDYGIQIDSLADMISFIVFPVVILYGIFKALDVSFCSYVLIPIVTVFSVCGISRLAYFNINTATEKKVEYYSGLPVTSTAIILPFIYPLKYVLSPIIFANVFLGMFAVIAFFMVYNFKLKKFKSNKWYVLFSMLAIIMTIILIILKVKH